MPEELDTLLLKRMKKALEHELRHRYLDAKLPDQVNLDDISSLVHIDYVDLCVSENDHSQVSVSGSFLSLIHLPIRRVRVRSGSREIRQPMRLKEASGSSPRQSFSIEFKPARGRREFFLDFEFKKGIWIPFFHGRSTRNYIGSTKITSLQVITGKDDGYRDWIAKYDCWSDKDQHAAVQVASSFDAQPLISIIMPTFRPDAKHLRAAINSIMAQAYENWQLCIADDASGPGYDIKKIIDSVTKRDQRVQFVQRQENGHIAEASNSALEIATGDYVTFIDQDDELAPYALYKVAETINRNPDVEFIYSDEDKIDAEGYRFDPYFKPDWNPDLLLRSNYTCHLSIYKKSLLEQVGGLQVGMEGCQDWDLALRCTAKLTPGQIVHIPHILYHWRSHAGSTSQNLDAKSYVRENAIKAVSDYFSRCGLDVEVSPGAISNHLRLRYPVPEPQPQVTLVIPTRNAHEILGKCLTSILELTDYRNFDVLIIDNGSDDPESLNYLRQVQQQESKVEVLRYDGEFNFASLCNLGVEHAEGSIIGLVNNDIEVIEKSWLREMVSHAIRSEIGAVGARLYYPDQTLQHAGVVLSVGGVAGHAFRFQHRKNSRSYGGRSKITANYTAVTAACLVVQKSKYKEVGGMDESNLAVAFNDVDFCLKLYSAGYRNLYCAEAELIHHESVSRGSDLSGAKLQRFKKENAFMAERWGAMLDADPNYNPNLTIDGEDFSLAFPPRVATSPLREIKFDAPSQRIRKFTAELPQ